MSTHDRVPTGCPLLDDLVAGGLPAGYAVAFAGSPGTGKRALARQFLRAGVDRDERCLYVTSERPRAFDDATPTSLDRDAPTLDVVEADAASVDEHLDAADAVDRVVLDHATFADAGHRRDVVRRCTHDLDATCLVVTEAAVRAAGDPDGRVEFGEAPLSGADVDGVVALRRERIGGDVHRFLRVAWLRGVDHDRRSVEVSTTDDGVRLGPARRVRPSHLHPPSLVSVGISGLDALCGGGFVRGAGVLLRHDGRANLNALFATLLAKALADGYTVELVPTIHLRPDRLERALAGYDVGLDALLEADRLFVLDMVGAWEAERTNVFAPPDDTAGVRSALSGIADRGNPPHFRLVNADAMVHALGADGARSVRYHQEASLLGPDDVLVHVQNPAVVDDAVASLYADTADQVIDLQVRDDGLQYVTLRKSPTGVVGASSLVEYTTDPPFLRVQRPPRAALERDADGQ